MSQGFKSGRCLIKAIRFPFTFGHFIIFLLSVGPTLGQSSFQDKVALYFQPLKLPHCTNYAESDRQTIEENFYDMDFDDWENNYRKRLPDEFVKAHFYADSNFAIIQNLWSRDTLSADSMHKHLRKNAYFAHGILVQTEIFIALLYEQVRDGGAVQFIVTVDPEGKFIDRIQYGFYIKSGTYTTDEGGRGPWFAHNDPCFETDWTTEAESGHVQGREHLLKDGRFQLHKE